MGASARGESGDPIAALVINQVTNDLAANLSAMIDSATQAADHGAQLVVFPEAALTGLANGDDPRHDLPLGQQIPGLVTHAFAALARERRIWLAVGLLERDRGALYSSAVLVSPDGSIALKYRRLTPGWHEPQADPRVYRQGLDMPSATTPFGRCAFVLCGDLFDDDVAKRVERTAPRLVLCLLARSFEGGAADQARWDAEEASYSSRVRRIGATFLLVNYIEIPSERTDAAFGGALAVSAAGDVIARWPVGTPGTLLVPLEPA